MRLFIQGHNCRHGYVVLVEGSDDWTPRFINRPLAKAHAIIDRFNRIHSETSMTTATLTNRFTGKSTRIALKTNPAGILWATSRQYNAALRKLGHGPLGSDTSFVVDSPAGRPVAAVEQTTEA